MIVGLIIEKFVVAHKSILKSWRVINYHATICYQTTCFKLQFIAQYYHLDLSSRKRLFNSILKRGNTRHSAGWNLLIYTNSVDVIRLEIKYLISFLPNYREKFYNKIGYDRNIIALTFTPFKMYNERFCGVL